MKHIIIGTAGHVDHGKTCLTRALTGVNTDRLKEEQKRGITIEIGFARLTLPNGQSASIIDVPGHEKFIRNMLVGAAGMDVVLLVVAADEGFMPQTREHLGILSLLGVQNGIIVITKSDMVEEEWLEAIMDEARETVKGTFLENAPMVPVSAYTGKNIEELKALIVTLVEGAEERNADRPFRLPVDRIFSVDGFGTVVTGTLTEGSLRVGDDVMIYPSQKKARIRGLQNHDSSVQEMSAGQRTAVNLAGVDKADLHRGDTLAKPDSMTLTSQIDVRITLLKDAPYSIKNDSQLHLHHNTCERLCKCVLLGGDVLNPGETGFAQLRLQEPLAGRNGDPFVLRFFSPTVTVGGGIFLNLSPSKHKRNDPKLLEGLAARASGSGEAQVLQAMNELGATLPKAEDIARSAGLTVGELGELLSLLLDEGKVIRAGDRYLSHAAANELWLKAEKLLTTYHRAQPLQDGMNRGEFRGKLLPKMPSNAVDALLDYFAAYRGLKLEGPTVALQDFSVVWNSFYTDIRRDLEAIYQKAGLSPENSDDIEYSFGKKADGCRQVAQRLMTDGVLVALDPQLRVHRTHYDKALSQLFSLFAQKPELTLGEIRDGLGISRKYALALLDYWDGIGVTKKMGDVRVLAKKS